MTDPPRPLRVLQIHAFDVIGGTELMVVRLAQRLNAAGMPTEVAILDGPGPIAALLRERGVVVHSLGAGSEPAKAWRLSRLLQRNEYDVVNAYGFRASMLVRLLRRPLRLRA